MAPEVIANRTYGKPCDVWAAGVMLHVLLSGRLPFMGSGKRLQDIMSRGRISVGRPETVVDIRDRKRDYAFTSLYTNAHLVYLCRT